MNEHQTLKPAPLADEHHIFYLVRRLREAAFEFGEADTRGYKRYTKMEQAVQDAELALRKEIEMQFRDAIDRL